MQIKSLLMHMINFYKLMHCRILGRIFPQNGENGRSTPYSKIENNLSPCLLIFNECKIKLIAVELVYRQM